MPNGNSPSREAAQIPVSATSKRGLGSEAWAALFRVRTRPECPEGNLRELAWDSNLDCGIAIPLSRDPEKSPNHCQARSQNKGLSRASRLWTGPSPAGDRQARAARWVCFYFVNKSICIVYFQIPCMSDIIQNFSFSVWLTSLRMTISKSIHVAQFHFF